MKLIMKNKLMHIAIFYESSDELVDILATSMASVCYNTSAVIDFYILNTGLNASNKKKLEQLKNNFSNFSIQFIEVDLSQFSNLKGYTANQFTDCYARLLIPNLAPQLNKAIYLDSDTIAIGDILKLWNQDLGGAIVGGVSDLAYGNLAFIKEAQIPDGHRFLNAGSLLIDCAQWRSKNITKKCFDAAEKYKKYLGAIIEDLFAVVLKEDEYTLLPFGFGFSEAPNRTKYLGQNSALSDDLFSLKSTDICIVHFTGENKPWKRKISWKILDQFDISINEQNQRTIRFFEDFWNFAEMTPFYAGLSKKFEANLCSTHLQYKTKKTYKLFMIFPLIKIIYKENITTYKLFYFIPIIKIINIKKSKLFKLFNFIPLLKIKEK